MKQRYFKNVVTLKVDEENCIGCGKCLDVCPHNVFAREDQKVKIQDRDACMECGACARNCPVRAVSVVAGVGCAWGVLIGRLKGTAPTCGCDESEEGESSCCG